MQAGHLSSTHGALVLDRTDRPELDTLEERDARVAAIIERIRHHHDEPVANPSRQSPAAPVQRKLSAIR
jgi:hypothetical protein